MRQLNKLEKENAKLRSERNVYKSKVQSLSHDEEAKEPSRKMVIRSSIFYSLITQTL